MDASADQTSAAPIDSALRIASVTLAVSDLERSVEFYQRVLGLPLWSRHHGRALLGDAEALELIQLPQPTTAPPSSTGLFHVAWLHPTRAGLAASVLRVADSGWPLDGASDHGVSEAVYLSDPDGLGIELYADRPRAAWQRPADGRGVVMYTVALDLGDLLASAPSGATPTVEPGTSVGHIHLKVADVARAVSFYRDTLGLQQQAALPAAAFLSAGGYHHHVGLNSWQSRGGAAAPDSAPGLRRVQFALSARPALDALAQRLAQSPLAASLERSADGGVEVSDPDGSRLSFNLG